MCTICPLEHHVNSSGCNFFAETGWTKWGLAKTAESLLRKELGTKLNKFTSDQPLVHPMYGLGTVESIDEQEVLGEKISLAEIVFPQENMKIKVNVNKETDLFRELISPNDIDKIFEHMIAHEGVGPARANQRQRMNLDKIKSNDIFLLSEVIKNLSLVSHKKKLSFKESEMFERAKRVMIEEMVTVSDAKPEAIHERITRACLPEV